MSKNHNKILRLNISREPHSFDPRKVFDPSDKALVSLLFEGLFTTDVNLNPIQAQVESHEVSEDRLIYTFHLGDYFWSDGSRVTAKDYQKTFLDHLDPKFPSYYASLLYDVLNAEEAKKAEVPLKAVGIRALDEKTLQIQLARPSSSFLQILSSPSLVPVCKAVVDRDPNWALSPTSNYVCNGPYTLEKWTPQSEIILKKNSFYSGKFKGKIPKIHISLIANEMTALHMYGNGLLDILGAPLSQIPLPFLKDLKKDLIVKPISASLYIAFNTQSPLFKNVNLRKAFSYAIDRHKIVDHITQLEEEPALSPIPSVLKGYFAPLIKDGDQLRAKAYFEKAKQNLGSEMTNRLNKITLYFWNMEVNYLIAQFLQKQWSDQLGVELNIEMIDFKILRTKAQNGSYDIAIFAWKAGYGDPLSLLQRLRHQNDSSNYSKWQDDRFSKLLDQISFEIDPKKRKELCFQAEKILVEQMPIAPLFHWNSSLLIQPQVQGFEIDPLGQIQFDKISIR